MLAYIERLKHRLRRPRLTLRNIAKLGAKWWFFALFCIGLRSWAVFCVPVQRIAIRCKPVHSNSDHSTENEVKVLWRDRPF